MCNAGDSEAACGESGASCQSCPTGTTCEGVCNPAIDALWQVFLQSAQTSETDPDGANWDSAGGAPDPYVEAVAAGRTETTDAIDNTTAPVWNQVVLVGLTTEEVLEGITFTLWDEDLAIDENMGTCGFAVGNEQFGIPLQGVCEDADENVLWTLQLSIEAAPQ